MQNFCVSLVDKPEKMAIEIFIYRHLNGIDRLEYLDSLGNIVVGGRKYDEIEPAVVLDKQTATHLKDEINAFFGDGCEDKCKDKQIEQLKEVIKILAS